MCGTTWVGRFYYRELTDTFKSIRTKRKYSKSRACQSDLGFIGPQTSNTAQYTVYMCIATFTNCVLNTVQDGARRESKALNLQLSAVRLCLKRRNNVITVSLDGVSFAKLLNADYEDTPLE
ncbi:hypothetical protein J6590_038057 [Homalodisca vitripennis]|nr:hypothetical protein J6590_038057 [Homalodisca vitripennis]